MSRFAKKACALNVTISFMFIAIGIVTLSAETPSDRTLKRRVRLQEGAQAMVNMPSVAPLFLEDSHFSSSLYIVNEGNPKITGRLLVMGSSGDIIVDKAVSVPGHDKLEVAIKPLLDHVHSQATQGTIELFDDNVDGSALVGQLVITFRGLSHSVNIDEELLMPSMSQSHELRGLAVDAVASPIVGITSTSEKPVDVIVRCFARKGGIAQQSLQLASHQTTTLRPCGTAAEVLDVSTALQLSNRNVGSPEAKGIQIVSSDPKAEIQAFGISPTLEGDELSFTPISFHAPDDALSDETVYPGVPVSSFGQFTGNFRTHLVIQNFSTEPRMITVHRARTSFGSATYEVATSFTIEPLAVLSEELPAQTPGPETFDSFVVGSDGQPGDIQTQLWSEETSHHLRIIFAGKDSKDERNAGMHPWTSLSGSHDDLFLYNETDTDQVVYLKVSNGSLLWNKALTLSAHETRRVSPRQLAEEQQPDDSNSIFKMGRGEGEISWFTNESGKVKGRLQHVDANSYLISSFQCAGYVVFCGINSISGPTPVQLRQSNTYSTYANSCVNNQAPSLCYGVYNGYFNGPSWQWSGFGPEFQLAGGGTTGQSIYLTSTTPGTAQMQVFAQSGSCNFQQSEPVVVSPPVPNNFRVTGSVDRGNGDLHIIVAWGSTSGDTDDLTACQVGETVTYQGANPYPLPSPPFPAITFQNPTEASTAATLFTGTDEHDFGNPAEPPPQFVKPYSDKSFDGTQTYWYSCSNVNNGARVTLWGPNTVTRHISSNGSGGYKFTVSETNVPNFATINPLP